MTKAGLIAMSEAIREELSDHNIGVSVLCPGPYKTNIREASLNRQGRYREGSGLSAAEAAIVGREDRPHWADPLDAGERVVKAITSNQLYVITHGEFKGWAESRFEDILAAYPPADPELLKAAGRRRPVNAYG